MDPFPLLVVAVERAGILPVSSFAPPDDPLGDGAVEAPDFVARL